MTAPINLSGVPTASATATPASKSTGIFASCAYFFIRSVYAKTKNIRAVQLLLGHTKIDNTIRYFGVELEDALRLSEGTDC